MSTHRKRPQARKPSKHVTGLTKIRPKSGQRPPKYNRPKDGRWEA